MTIVTYHHITAPETQISCKIAVHEMGDKNKPALYCVHGLTRNAKDFYPLAEALADDYYVLMPDIPGRGESDYFSNPAFYNNGMYALLMVELLEQIGHKRVRWIGTSMGGLIGMIIAATKPKLISSLLLNDIGSLIPAAAIARIKEYTGAGIAADDYETLAAQIRKNLVPFGIQDIEILEHFVSSSIVADGDSYRLNYDPNITASFAEWGDGDVDLSELWNAIKCKTMIFRGESSDLLLRETAEQMAAKDNAELLEIANAGHAPSLTTTFEIEKINQWLKQPV